MTNEEKIKELISDYLPTVENCDTSIIMKEALIEMAKYKEEQSKIAFCNTFCAGNKIKNCLCMNYKKFLLNLNK